jgi:hypothetical protein
LGFSLQTSARLDAVEITVDGDLQPYFPRTSTTTSAILIRCM